MLLKEFLCWCDIYTNYQTKVHVFSNFFTSKINMNIIKEIKSVVETIKIVCIILVNFN